MNAARQKIEALIRNAAEVGPALQIRDETDRVILTRGDGIKPEAISWLWDGWIASGKFQVLAGAPGTGKTTIALAIAATLTMGSRWPDGTAAPQGSVVIWSGEDDPKDTLVPRLMAMGADMTRIQFVGGVVGPNGPAPFDPSRDVTLLSAAMATMNDVVLLVVDPIVSAVAGDSHKNAETRRGLQPLVDLATRHDCALLGITHLSKGTAGRDPTERVTGSLAFGAVARVVLLAAKQQSDDEGPKPRLLVRAKSNIGPDTGGFEYDLIQTDVPGYPALLSSSVRWAAAVEGNARELLADAETVTEKSDDSAGFLRELLVDGPMSAKDIYRESEGAGYSRDAMKRAKDRIGALTRKQGMAAGWMWSLPDFEPRAEGSEGSTLKRLHSSHPSGLSPHSSGNGAVTL